MIDSFKNIIPFLVATLVVFTVCSAVSAQPAPMPAFKTVCAGSAHPKSRIIFLQGIMYEQQDADYVALLDKVGKDLNIRFAIPSSKLYCKNSQTAYCWGTEEPGSVARVYENVRHSAAACFSLKQEWGLLGFSNGGYHAGRVIAQGHTPAPTWAMAIGSAGQMQASTLDHRAKRIPFYLEVGTEDIVREKAHGFFLQLKNNGFNVRYSEYPGGHELTEETLRTVLGEVL